MTSTLTPQDAPPLGQGRVVLSNACLSATVDGASGRLLAIHGGRNKEPVAGAATIQYRCGGRLVSERADLPDAQPPAVLGVTRTRQAITSVLSTPELRITRGLFLPTRAPLLRLRYEIVASDTLTRPISLEGPALLHMALPDDMLDPATDEKDCYFDGAELGDGLELPCWRVLFADKHQRGLLVAARSKWQMSHVMYERRRLEIWPHVRAQQQVDYTARNIPIELAKGGRLVVEWEMGPWEAKRHRAILAAARLDRPSAVETEPTPPAPPHGPGHLFWVADFARPAALSPEFHPRRWLKSPLPWNARQMALICNTGCRPPSILIRPKLSGPYRVFVRGSRAVSLGLHFSGDPYPLYRYGIGGTAFHSVLHGLDQARELDFGIVDMTGKTVRVVANHNGHWPARIDYLRFEPLTPQQAQAWQELQGKPRMLLAGIPDCGDVFFSLMDRHRLDPRIIAGNIWEQSRAGITRLYWQMHGTYTGFHTRIGTRQPMACYGHGAFEPQIKSSVLFQRKHDLLALAAKTCRELGLEFWGTARLNSYMSGKRDRFFQERPQHAEITEDGTLCGNKICYAIPEVRDYQRAILLEAAAYGLQGIMLGVLRHPPLLLYHPVLVSGYRHRYGKLPPREPGRADPHHVASLPCYDEEHVRWYAYRAQFMTQFVRDLKRDLRDRGFGHIKISAWVRPNHCLFDGVDLETWLKEGLCDEVVADIYSDPSLDEPTAEWRRMVQGRVPLLRGIGFSSLLMSAADLRRAMGQGYDGLCAYGSEQFAQTASNQPLIDLLRAGSTSLKGSES